MSVWENERWEIPWPSSLRNSRTFSNSFLHKKYNISGFSTTCFGSFWSFHSTFDQTIVAKDTNMFSESLSCGPSLWHIFSPYTLSLFLSFLPAQSLFVVGFICFGTLLISIDAKSTQAADGGRKLYLWTGRFNAHRYPSPACLWTAVVVVNLQNTATNTRFDWEVSFFGVAPPNVEIYTDRNWAAGK